MIGEHSIGNILRFTHANTGSLLRQKKKHFIYCMLRWLVFHADSNWDTTYFDNIFQQKISLNLTMMNFSTFSMPETKNNIGFFNLSLSSDNDQGLIDIAAHNLVIEDIPIILS